MMTTKTRFMLASAPAMLIAAAGALAQATTQPERQDRPGQVQPGTQTDRAKPAHAADAARKDMALRITKVDNATLRDSNGAEVGEIDDLLIDTASGRVVYAIVTRGGVVGIGEERHPVPWQLVKVATAGQTAPRGNDLGDDPNDNRDDNARAGAGDDAELRFVLASGVTLDGSPSFTLTTRPDFNAPDWNRQIRDHYKVDAHQGDDTDDRPGVGEPPDAADRPAGQPEPAIAAVSRPMQLVLASDLTDTEVENLQEEDFGEISDAVFSADTGKINYIIVSVGGFLGIGEEYAAVPFSALQIRPEDPDDADDLIALLNIDEERFRNAPRFARDQWPDFNDRQWGEPIHRYYGTEPYWLEDDGEMMDDGGAMAPAAGQDRSATLFMQGRTTDVTGDIASVREDVTFEGLGRGTQITVNGDEGPMLVHLAPGSFLQEHNLELANGDQVTISGAKVNVGGRDVILARTIEKDGTSVTLRDEQGRPQW